MSSISVSPKGVENICEFYHLDAKLIVRERNSFVPVYGSMAPLIDASDLSLMIHIIRTAMTITMRDRAAAETKR
jgi:hypothetical protein